MAIKQILDKIKGTLGADASAELSSLIADAIREADDMTDSLASVNKESKSRKEKIREMEAQLESLNEKLANNDPSKHQAEIDRLKQIEGKYNEVLTSQESELRQKWQEYAKVFSVDKTDKRYEIVTSVKDQFKFADADAELPIEHVKANLASYELLQKAKAFDAPAPGSPQPAPKPLDGQDVSKFQSGGQALAAKLSKTK